MPNPIGSATYYNPTSDTRPTHNSQNLGGTDCWNSQVNGMDDNVHRDSYCTKPKAAEYSTKRPELPGVNRFTKR
ncbi:unnamed protein product [marine sediment metagenome]|uniref:Uncharacterized protein n=1 Tax=marine sediment metagenome TaxID=412755 RepID=X1QMU4_9ZZZZ